MKCVFFLRSKTRSCSKNPVLSASQRNEEMKCIKILIMKKAAISSNTHPMPCLFYLIIIWGLTAVARNQTCKEGIYSAEGKSQNRSGLLLSEGGMPRGPSEPQTFSWKCARLLLGSEARVAVTGTLRY